MTNLKNKQNSNIFAFISLIAAFIAFGLFLFFGMLFQTAIFVHLGLAVLAFLGFAVSGGISRLFSSKVRRNSAGEVLKKEYSSALRLSYSVLTVFCFGLCFYIIQTRFPFQIDTTKENVYTLSEQTRSLLSKTQKDLKARYFLRGLNSVKADIEILKRYNNFSKNFLVTQHDLDKERPLADSLGINAINSLFLSLGEDDAKGVVISGGLTEEKITNAILKLTRAIKPTAYFTRGHGEGDFEDETEGGFSLLKESLESDGFNVQPIDLSVAGEVQVKNSVIVFLSPSRDLFPLELAQLKEYVSKGGNIFVFAEPRIRTNLIDYVSSLGFEIGNDTIVGLEKFTTAAASLGVQPVISQYADHPSLKNFEKSIIVSAAVSVRKKAAADSLTEIAYTAEDTWAESNLKDLYSKTPTAVKDQDDLFGPVSIAAVSDLKLPGDASSSISQRIVVVGDLDFSANVNLYQLFNRDFILNLMNWVVGDEENISIRAGSLTKSMKIISENEYSSIFLWTGLVLPELILFFGFYSWQKGRWS